jgi:uncharacterized membrane protein
MEKNVRIATRILLYAVSAFLLVVGSDKAFHLEKITDWEAYVGPLAATVFPFSAAETIVRIQGCIEILYALLLIFTGWKRTALAFFMLSMVCVIIDLAYFRYFIVVTRDLVLLAVAAALMFLLTATSKQGTHAS